MIRFNVVLVSGYTHAFILIYSINCCMVVFLCIDKWNCTCACE